jgi:hypothetical protein
MTPRNIHPVGPHAEASLLRQVRRAAAEAGERVWKIRESSRWFAEYGPFAIVDNRNAIIAWSIPSVESLAEQYGVSSSC